MGELQLSKQVIFSGRFKEIGRISSAQIKLLSAVRAEIGLDTDISELNRRMEENQLRMENAAADLLTRLEIT